MSFKTLEVGIAVDFGMTGSVVAWKTADDPEEIHTIRQRPSCGFNSLKTPTQIKINPSGSISWGFQCKSDNGSSTKELFKVLLDPVFHSPDRAWFYEQSPRGIDEVKLWIYVYIRSLIGHAMTVIGDNLQKRLGTTSTPI